MTMSRSPSADKHSPVASTSLLPANNIVSRSPGPISASEKGRRATFGLEGQSSASEPEDWDEESLVSENSGTLIASNEHSTEGRAESLARLRTQLQQGGQSESGRGKATRLPGHISPYNAINPFYGYPAQRFVATASDGSLAHTPGIRPYHSRRRKRDLLKTLSYLFALRLLALHRKLKWRLSVTLSVIWNALARWDLASGRVRAGARRTSSEASDEADAGTPAKRKKGVHWDAQVASRQEKRNGSIARLLWPVLVLRRIPRWLIFLSLVLFVRSRFFKMRARALVLLVKARAKEIYLDYRERRLKSVTY